VCVISFTYITNACHLVERPCFVSDCTQNPPPQTCRNTLQVFHPHFVFYINVGGWVRRNTTVVGSYFYWIDDDYVFRPGSAIFRSN